MPFENPNGLSNFVEMLAILLIPAGADRDVRAHGRQPPPGLGDLRGDVDPVRRSASRSSTPPSSTARRRSTWPASARPLRGSTGGNLEGKEQRFGIADSALWTAVTTVTSCGAVNAAFESLTGLGGAVPFANLSMSEVVFGGVGTGLYSMLLFVLLAVFIGGLMVGRTPEYLGKKIGAREIKLVTLGSLFTPLTVLMTSAAAIAAPAGQAVARRRRPAGLLREALRLPLAGQQQRLGVGRLHRLHPARTPATSARTA